MLNATIIKDSYSPCGERLTTFEVEFHRFILPELNTHRVFSRNYQSSRAVPVEKLIEQVRENPALPVHWGKNQAGMVAEEEITSAQDFGQGEYQWRGAAIHAAERAQTMLEQGYHKQIVNRLLEPFMWTRGVITASEEGFNSFFKLRCHPDAQPEIQALAYLMRDAYEASKPQQLKYGEWHLPYVDSKEGTLDNIRISTSCVAQVSYRKLDDSLEKAKKIYDMLNLPCEGVYPENPPHFSPSEHVAMPSAGLSAKWKSGNFNETGEWFQYRKMLEVGVEMSYIKEIN